MSTLSRLLAAALTLLLIGLANGAHAQAGAICPDGFTGPCCSPASPNLPQFPQVGWQDAREICTIDCQAAKSTMGQLVLGAPTPMGPCGVYRATLSGSILACPAPNTSGLTLYYTRQWPQSFPGVGPVLVYRFVAVGNLCVGPTATWSCAVEPPPAMPFVFGFVDYAFRKVGPSPCQLQFVAAALALGHPCDRFVHDPSCAFVADPRPPTHPVDQFVLVAPGSNFVPNANLVPPQGAGLNTPREAIRQLRVGAAGTCETNELINSVQLKNVIQQCACVNPSLAGGPYTRQSLRVAAACGSTVDTMPICPFGFTPPPMVQPFPTLAAWSIGAWMPGQFPGVLGGNKFFLAQAGGVYQKGATPICPPINPAREVYYGVENRWDPPNGKAGKRVDLVDNVNPVLGTNTVMPVVGGPGSLGTHVVFFF